MPLQLVLSLDQLAQRRVQLVDARYRNVVPLKHALPAVASEVRDPIHAELGHLLDVDQGEGLVRVQDVGVRVAAPLPPVVELEPELSWVNEYIEVRRGFRQPIVLTATQCSKK